MPNILMALSSTKETCALKFNICKSSPFRHWRYTSDIVSYKQNITIVVKKEKFSGEKEKLLV